jgi:glycerate-2-kinase
MTPLERDARKIFDAGLRAADPYEATVQALRARQELWRRAARIFVVGAGRLPEPWGGQRKIGCVG